MSAPSDAERIVAGLSHLGARLDLASLTLYIDEVLRWNDRLGLVGKRDPGGVISRLVRTSVHLWDFLAEGAPASVRPGSRIMDLGSGAGFPGVPWTLLARGANIVLVDRKAHRAFFIERAIHRMGVDARVLHADVGELAHDARHRGMYDAVGMLAVAPPARIAETVGVLLAPSGVLVNARPGEGEVEATSGPLRLLERRTVDAAQFVLYAAARP